MNTTSQDLFRVLEERGFVHQCTDTAAVRQSLSAGPVTAYIGFDATADSLHVGHLQGLMLMRWFQRAGHKPLLLVGGATTRIGDPSFRDTSRPVLDEAAIARNIEGISSAFTRFLTVGAGASDAKVVNNADWMDQLGFMDFLGNVGSHFTVNKLLALDAIKSRLENSLSVQEFMYTLLQAMDAAELAKREGCTLQVGGADQWANIINGIELARRRDGQSLQGLTMPLLATADGKKMGKSAAGAVWLNEARLSVFDFWQFWRNTDDRDVERFLALFTELAMPEVRRLGQLQGRELNEAKAILATEATALAHGRAAAEAAARAAMGGAPTQADLAGLPTFVVSLERVQAGLTLATLAAESGLTESKEAARRLAKGGGFRVDGVKVEDADQTLGASAQEWKLSAGKKHHLRVLLEV